MHIGVSAWRLYGQRLGIGRYIEYQLKHWSLALADADRVTVFVHEPFDSGALGLSDAFSMRVIRPKLTDAIWENLLLPVPARDVDVMFGPSYTIPLTFPGRKVVVIHSVDEAEPGARSWRHLLYTQKYRLCVQRATRVIATSHSTAERACDVYGISRDKIDVIWHGVDDQFRPLDDESICRTVRERYFGRDRPYVLFVGGLSARRNVPMLLEAFARLRRQHHIPHGLLLVGPKRDGIALEALCERLGISDSVVQTDGRFATHREIVPIYGAADVFVLPSISEGFSLTLAEAMSCGTPVITVNKASLGEVACGYALTIREPALDDLADALLRIVTDEQLRLQLRAKSLERSQRFRWATSAQQTLDVLRKAVS